MRSIRVEFSISHHYTTEFLWPLIIATELRILIHYQMNIFLHLDNRCQTAFELLKRKLRSHSISYLFYITLHIASKKELAAILS